MKIDYPQDVAEAGPKTKALYRRCLKNGCKPRMAQMLAMQQAPKALTDRELFAGKGTLADQFEGQEDCLAETVAAARAQGYEPNRNDFYNPVLARQKGDPLAFIPPTGGRNHIRRVCEMRGDACEGTVNVKGRESLNPPQPKKLADDIVNRSVNDMIAKDPSLKSKPRQELKDAVIDKHGAKS